MPVIKSVWTKIRKEEDGGVIIDFGVSIAIVLMVVFGILDFSRAVYIDHFLATAARSATRYAMVRGSSFGGTSCSSTSSFNCAATSTDVSNYVKSIADSGIDSRSLRIETSWPGTDPTGSNCNNIEGNNSPGCVVKVKVDYQLTLALPFLPSNLLALSSSSIVDVSR